MIKEARGFGDSIAEAQENARVNLGVAQDADIQYEIISQSKKKVIILKRIPRRRRPPKRSRPQPLR